MDGLDVERAAGAGDPNSVLERQLGIAGVYVLSQVLFLLPGVTVLHAAPVAAGGW